MLHPFTYTERATNTVARSLFFLVLSVGVGFHTLEQVRGESLLSLSLLGCFCPFGGCVRAV